jgi:hypothetical protein
MAIALIGLSWFQFYWINSVINLSNERFEKDALESMVTVVNKLERNEMAVVATNSFSFFSTDLQDTSEIRDDNDTTVQKVWFRTNKNDNIKIVLSTDSNNEIY